MQRMHNLERRTENGLIEHVMDVISVVMQLWWLHRLQQRISFSSSSDGWMDGWKDDDGCNVPSLWCLVILARLVLFSKKGGETVDEKPRDLLCRKAWICPQGETESKEMEWWRTQQQEEEEEEERSWAVPLHQRERGGAVQLGRMCFVRLKLV